jgi:CspA family cold shock protein
MGTVCFGRVHGRVESFDDSGGYGYIEKDGQRIYVHYSAIEGEGHRTLSRGDEVEFDLIDGSCGPEAWNVRVL